MSKGSVLILGGASDIGLAIARRFAQEGHPIQLAARRPYELETEKSDIELRYRVGVTLHRFDALDTASHEAFVRSLPTLPEIAVCAVGLLGDQRVSERDVAAAVLVMRSNYEGPASILGVMANHFEQRGSGTIVGISSVAGDRGRASNYVYGSAKAGYTAFLSGLRNRLFKKGVHVVAVKPGYVRTKMIDGVETPSFLTAAPSDIADLVARSVEHASDTLYANVLWKCLMLAIKLLPERLFKKMQI